MNMMWTERMDNLTDALTNMLSVVAAGLEPLTLGMMRLMLFLILTIS
jgi:hypothetical protein